MKMSLAIAPVSILVAPAFGQLNQLAKSAGKKYFGTSSANPSLSDRAYVAQLSNVTEFGQLTPGNSMKWAETEPSRGRFTFSKAQEIVSLARKNGQLVRGHTCVWYSQLPTWVSDGHFNATTLTTIVYAHCSNLIGHFKGQIWDVVNEPFNEDGTFHQDVFYKTLGTSYISIALRAAHAADPTTKLYINDHNIEGSGPKSTAMINLVKSLKASRVPIDGIGIQAHLVVGRVPSTLKANLQAFTALGVDVALTELDIRMKLPATPALLAQQSKDYQTVIAACKAVRRCVGVTIWDYTDKYSWIPNSSPGMGAALPWDNKLVKKPAYIGIANGWKN